MAKSKRDTDLFDRLRKAGLRKQVAGRFSEVGDGAGKKVIEAARAAIGELRALADELERRIQSAQPGSAAAPATRRRTRAKAPAARAKAPAARAKAPARGASATATRTRAAARPKPAAASTARAPRGANKAKILGSLKSGAKTAAEIAKETGISTGTVGSTLSKLAVSGEVVKAPRGYQLPG
jgi:hypothetical protein